MPGYAYRVLAVGRDALRMEGNNGGPSVHLLGRYPSSSTGRRTGVYAVRVQPSASGASGASEASGWPRTARDRAVPCRA